MSAVLASRPAGRVGGIGRVVGGDEVLRRSGSAQQGCRAGHGAYRGELLRNEMTSHILSKLPFDQIGSIGFSWNAFTLTEGKN